MQILLAKNHSYDLTYLYESLMTTLTRSRFVTSLEIVNSYTLKFRMVRLKVRKPYCGNHPAHCETRGIVRKPRKLNFLEGADWVAFNDLLNDVLDSLAISATVKSSACLIRKGHLTKCS